MFAIGYRSNYPITDDHRLVFQYLEVFHIGKPAMGEGDEGGIVIDVFLYLIRKGGLGYRLQTDEQARPGKEKFFHIAIGFGMNLVGYLRTLLNCILLNGVSTSGTFSITA